MKQTVCVCLLCSERGVFGPPERVFKHPAQARAWCEEQTEERRQRYGGAIYHWYAYLELDVQP